MESKGFESEESVNRFSKKKILVSFLIPLCLIILLSVMVWIFIAMSPLLPDRGTLLEQSVQFLSNDEQLNTADRYKGYNELYFNGRSRPAGAVDHYRVFDSSVVYYKNCSGLSLFETWCKLELTGVSPGEFFPLSKDIAKVVTDRGSVTEIRIFRGDTEVSAGDISDPSNFIALESYNTNPVYFSDGAFIYHRDAPPLGGNNNSAAAEYFPIKISEQTTYESPRQFQRVYELAGCNGPTSHSRVLFVDNRVYLDGELVPGADAASFELIPYQSAVFASGPWFKDVNNVYFNGQVVVEADPKTFFFPENATNPNPNWWCTENNYPSLAADENYVYYVEKDNDPSCQDMTCPRDLRIPGVSPVGLSVPGYVGERPVAKEQTIRTADGVFYLDGKEYISPSREPSLRAAEMPIATALTPGSRGRFSFLVDVQAPEVMSIAIPTENAFSVIYRTADATITSRRSNGIETLQNLSNTTVITEEGINYYRINAGETARFRLVTEADFSDFSEGAYRAEIIKLDYVSKLFTGTRSVVSDETIITPNIQVEGG